MRARLALVVPIVLMAAAATAADLAGTAWRPVEVAAAPVPDGIEAAMVFGADGTVSGSSGCNRFTGSYGLDGDAIGPVAMTRMACPGPVMTFETVFLGALDAARTAAQQDTELVLTDEAGSCASRRTTPIESQARRLFITATSSALMPGSERAWPAVATTRSSEPGQASCTA